MSLRHAVLVALLDGDASGYQLTKIFDVSVSNFWAAVPQQVYAELPKLERAGYISGREVVQQDRPNKRVYTITDAGRAELSAFIQSSSKPGVIRDGLVVKVFALGADATDDLFIADQLDERADQAEAKVKLFTQLLHGMLAGRDEYTYLSEQPRIGPYLTCRRGQMFEADNARGSRWAAAAIRARLKGEPVPPPPIEIPSL